jgi:hypothetical protein
MDSSSMDMKDQKAASESLNSAQEECEQLRLENARLRNMLGIQNSTTREIATPETSVAEVFTPDKKIALFRSLIRGREDVYAVRWDGKNGRSGYAPAGAMDWRAIHAARPEVRKKIARKTRMLEPLSNNAIRNHLTGKVTIGIYPLLPDENCWFLAVDFDKKSWMADAAAFAVTCRRFQVPFAVDALGQETAAQQYEPQGELRPETSRHRAGRHLGKQLAHLSPKRRSRHY